VVVITILGILAAFAVPRFLSLDAQARAASVQGLAGSVRSASSLARAMWLANGTAPASLTIDGQTIDFTNGYPSVATIDNMLQDTTGFGYNETTGVFSRNGATTAATCQVLYTPATTAASPVVTAPTGGC